MNQLHFCGGLPRSGSTILMNILQQNPRVFTTGTCALADILGHNVLVGSRHSEAMQAMSVEQADKALYGLIHGATKGWFEALTNKPTVISKRHGWSSMLHLFPESKYICMVRDLRDVVESFENITKRTLALHSFNENNLVTASMNMYEKYHYYFQESSSISTNLYSEIPRLTQIAEQNEDKVIFIRYEDFTKDPISTLAMLYERLGEASFDHDLSSISHSELMEHDGVYFQERTDHNTHPEFMYYKAPERMLRDEFHQKVMYENRWFYETFYPEELS